MRSSAPPSGATTSTVKPASWAAPAAPWSMGAGLFTMFGMSTARRPVRLVRMDLASRFGR